MESEKNLFESARSRQKKRVSLVKQDASNHRTHPRWKTALRVILEDSAPNGPKSAPIGLFSLAGLESTLCQATVCAQILNAMAFVFFLDPRHLRQVQMHFDVELRVFVIFSLPLPRIFGCPVPTVRAREISTGR